MLATRPPTTASLGASAGQESGAPLLSALPPPPRTSPSRPQVVKPNPPALRAKTRAPSRPSQRAARAPEPIGPRGRRRPVSSSGTRVPVAPVTQHPVTVDESVSTLRATPPPRDRLSELLDPRDPAAVRRAGPRAARAAEARAAEARAAGHERRRHARGGRSQEVRAPPRAVGALVAGPASLRRVPAGRAPAIVGRRLITPGSDRGSRPSRRASSLSLNAERKVHRDELFMHRVTPLSPPDWVED